MASAFCRFEEFLISIGCPARLSQVGIGGEKLDRYARDAVSIISDGEGRLSGRPPMSEADIAEVLRSAL